MSLRDISSPAELELLNDLDGAVTPTITPRQSQDPAVSKKKGGGSEGGDGGSGKVHMKKQLGLLEGCAIILGIIFGSGEKDLKFYQLESLNITLPFSSRDLRLAQGRPNGGGLRGHLTSDLGSVRFPVNGRCLVLCRAGNTDPEEWWRLCLHLRSLRVTACLSLPLGCDFYLCVS